jgi:hypothetical protein
VPAAILFIGLTLVYVCGFFASLFPHAAKAGERGLPSRGVRLGDLGERALGLFRLPTGVWLMYPTWAAALNLSLGCKWPL